MISKQQIGREYRIKTLKFLACVGYATTRQISMAVLGACDVSSRKMAALDDLLRNSCIHAKTHWSENGVFDY